MNAETEKQIAEIHAVVVHGNKTPAEDRYLASLVKAARAVVDARYSGLPWNYLANAIGALEDIVGRSDPKATADCRPGSR